MFPHIAEQADDIAFIRSMHTSHSNHYNATLGMHTGSFAFARPGIGAWVSYGLGTVSQNLPSFLVFAPQMPYAGTQVWASDFLPGAHQGTRVFPGPEPVANLARRVSTTRRQELELSALAAFSKSHRSTRADDPQLATRIKAFETAHGMQTKMPAALDMSEEAEDTLSLYGMTRETRDGFGWQCLAARRTRLSADRHCRPCRSGCSLMRAIRAVAVMLMAGRMVTLAAGVARAPPPSQL